ncbi:kinase-like domain-containing protein [Amanita rubescens]|nr:kinase-like domain-containing protein [Amanita rubescens]
MLVITVSFVLPLLGIYEDQDASQLFLVSPYMKNGTLAQWRKAANPSTLKIGERMLEVAQGIQYIHSEGVVHGDLRGDNVLLDSNFHVQIADFGLTRHLEATVTKSGALHHNFAAPELFGDWDAEDDTEDDDQSMARTQLSDIYAFGCLYYEIHYDVVPFAGLKEMQIIKVVCRGERPPRLEVPSLSDRAWKLMQECWAKEKTTRPGIEDVVKRMVVWETLQESAPTQHRCAKNERAFSNGFSDVALLTVTAPEPPLSLSMMFSPGWAINDIFRKYRILFFYLFFPGFMWLFITSLDHMRSTVAQSTVEQRTETIEQPTLAERLAAAAVTTSTTKTAVSYVTMFQTPWTVVTMPTEPVTIMTMMSKSP